jgi:hypothetical protein
MKGGKTGEPGSCTEEPCKMVSKAVKMSEIFREKGIDKCVELNTIETDGTAEYPL